MNHIRSSIYEETESPALNHLLESRIILISTGVTEVLAKNVISNILYLDSINNEDISIYINSPGGYVTSGLAIYDTMKYVKSDIKTVCMGEACSMGAFLLSSGTKGKRFSLPSSRIMIHQPSGGSYGQATDIEIQTKEMLTIKKYLNQILAKNTGKPIKEVEKDTDRDYFMSAKEALKYGLIDEIISKKK